MQIQPEYNPDAFIVKTTLFLSSTLIIFAAATLTPSLPAMQAHFANVENAEFLVKLVVVLPSFFILVGSPFIGMLVDYLGRKSILVTSIIFFGFLGSVGYFIPSLMGILATRAFLGLAVAGIVTSVTTLIGDYYTGDTRVKVLGLQAAFIGIGAIVALLIGGVLADISWRNPFLVHLVAFFILPFIFFVIKEPKRVVNEGKSQLLNPLPNQGVEEESINVPIKLLSFIYITAFVGELMLYLVPLNLPFYLQALTGTNAKESSIAIAAMSLFFIIGSLLFAKIKQKLDYMTIVVVSLGLISISYEIVGWFNNYLLILIGLTICGFGGGILVPNLDSWLTGKISSVYRGRAVGGLTAATFMGQFLSPVLSQPLIENLDFDTATNYSLIYILSGCVLIIFVITVFLIGKIKKQQLDLFKV
jgi:MFS family permease